MPTLKLTQAAADKLKPGDQPVTYWDSQCPGFGLRITPRGRRTWLAMYRVDGKAVMETLGTMGERPSVADARDRARASMVRAREGVNPVVKRRAEKAAAAQAAAEAEIKGVTFAETAERFLHDHIERNSAPKYAREVRRILCHDVLPVWGDRPIRDITKHDVNDLLDAKADRRERTRKGTRDGAAVQANRTLTRLRTLFRWAADMDLIDADPTAGVRQRVKEKARDRALDDDEIKLFWGAAGKLGWPFGPLFKLLLLTAQRRDEVGGMRRPELDLDQRTIWTIPRERAKSDRAHIVHLSAPAVEIIEALPHTGALLFSATGLTPASGYSRAKIRIDKLMTAALREATGDPEAEITPWILHDLRRTATTGMAKLKMKMPAPKPDDPDNMIDVPIPPHVVDKILNHSAGAIRGVAAVYNRHEYGDERKAALDAWGRYLTGLVQERPTNVVELPRRA
jgi:integrase